MLCVGDYVELVRDSLGGPPLGSVGVVVRANISNVLVDWEGFTKGHSGGGLCETMSGWLVDNNKVRAITPETENIHINPNDLFDLVFTGGECNE